MNRSTMLGAVIGALVSGALVAAFYETRSGPVATVDGAETKTGVVRAPQPSGGARAEAPVLGGAAGKSVTPEAGERRAPAEPEGTENAVTPQTLAQKNVALEAQVKELEAKLAAATNPKPRSPHDVPQAELNELARNCRLQWDYQGFGTDEPPKVSSDDAKAVGVSAGDQKKLDAVLSAYNTSMTQQVRALYTELTGDSPGSMAVSSMISELSDKTITLDHQRIFQTLARERAGLQAAGDVSHASPYERLMRLTTGAGDSLEKQMGDAVGPEVARKLRDLHGGFGYHSSSSNGCPPE